MQAIVYRRYGPPSVLEPADLDEPVPQRDELLVHVRAAGVNPGDWDVLHGSPYVLRPMTGLRRPKNRVLGLAVAGTVEAVGPGVSTYRPGDPVFAEMARGGFAEYACAHQDSAAPLPPHVTFEQAATVPVTGVTALQGLRDVGRARVGQHILVNGASGGVGTFAVQIAKVLGAEVTGVCSTRNVDLVRSIGADHVIDYTREDFTEGEQRYDLLFDNVGNRSQAECRRVLAPTGTLIPNSNKGGGRWFGGFLPRAARALAVSPFVRQKLRPFAARTSGEDLIAVGELIESGKVVPIIDSTYPLRETAEALAYYGTGRVRGKLVITL